MLTEFEDHVGHLSDRRAQASQIGGDENGEEALGAQRIDRLRREAGGTVDIGSGDPGDLLADLLRLARQHGAEAVRAQLHARSAPP